MTPKLPREPLRPSILLSRFVSKPWGVLRALILLAEWVQAPRYSKRGRSGTIGDDLIHQHSYI